MTLVRLGPGPISLDGVRVILTVIVSFGTPDGDVWKVRAAVGGVRTDHFSSSDYLALLRSMLFLIMVCGIFTTLVFSRCNHVIQDQEGSGGVPRIGQPGTRPGRYEDRVAGADSQFV